MTDTKPSYDELVEALRGVTENFARSARRDELGTINLARLATFRALLSRVDEETPNVVGGKSRADRYLTDEESTATPSGGFPRIINAYDAVMKQPTNRFWVYQENAWHFCHGIGSYHGGEYWLGETLQFKSPVQAQIIVALEPVKYTGASNG